MRFLQPILVFALFSVISCDPALESETKALRSITATPTPAPLPDIEVKATDIIYQSTDAGQTWQDISHGLPSNEQPEDFFAGASDLYMRVKDGIYRSKANLRTPVWEKETALGAKSASIVFNRSGIIAYNFEGEIYQRISDVTWLPRYTNFRKRSMRTIFETSDGILFSGYDTGLYKSVDNGKNWKLVRNEGWVMDFVEANGVLLATGQNGIMRSTDKGENWEWVIREGGGIAIERIDGGFAAISSSQLTISRRIRISNDEGKTWKAIDQDLRPSLNISSIKQVGNYLLVGHPDGIFRSSDMGKTWMLVHSIADISAFNIKTTFTENGKVFKLYRSGNVVYAVARASGC